MLRIAVLLLSVLLVHVAAGAVKEDKNLVKNPGFEETKDGKPASWNVAGFSDGGKGTLGISTEKPHGGKSCAVIKGNGEWGTYVSTMIPIQKGKTYELKGFVRVAKGTATLKFDYFNGDKYIGMSAPENTESADWVELSVTSELNNHPEATHLTATLVGAGGEYEAYFDDIVLVEKK